MRDNIPSCKNNQNLFSKISVKYFNDSNKIDLKNTKNTSQTFLDGPLAFFGQKIPVGSAGSKNNKIPMNNAGTPSDM